MSSSKNHSIVSTVTVMNHAPTRSSRTREHDPPINDQGICQWATNMYMMDVGYNKKSKTKYTIYCSPFQRCIETAVCVAQSLGIKSIRIHYGLGESVSTIRSNGWDWSYVPLYLTPAQMHLVVDNMQEPGTECSIEGIYGRKLGATDITEAEDQLFLRVSETLDEIKNQISAQGDHVICVGHTDTVRIFVQHFGPSVDAQVFDFKHCGFVSLAVASKDCYWLRTRSRVKAYIEPPSIH